MAALSLVAMAIDQHQVPDRIVMWSVAKSSHKDGTVMATSHFPYLTECQLLTCRYVSQKVTHKAFLFYPP